MSKLKIIALSGVMHRVRSTGPSTEPCGTLYASVILSDRVSLIFTNWTFYDIFINMKHLMRFESQTHPQDDHIGRITDCSTRYGQARVVSTRVRLAKGR